MLRFFFLIEFKGCFCIISDYTYLINIGWIRIRMDPELLPGSRSGTRKIQSWIRIWNKSFRIHNIDKKRKISSVFFLQRAETTDKNTHKQCCGSGMIYSGSSFEFSEFRIRIWNQAKVPDPCGSGRI